ncbi:hypothetical protein BJX70DRAFT_401728 [Aspergillus crustosus]
MPQEVQQEETPAGLTIQLGPHHVEDELVVKLGETPQLANPSRNHEIKGFLRQAQMSLDIKDEIWRIVSKESSAAVRAEELVALNLRREILTAVLELLLASA